LLKLWHDEEGGLRIELRQTEADKPRYFAELDELKRYLEIAIRDSERAVQKPPIGNPR
jgi:hypothetical protein